MKTTLKLLTHRKNNKGESPLFVRVRGKNSQGKFVESSINTDLDIASYSAIWLSGYPAGYPAIRPAKHPAIWLSSYPAGYPAGYPKTRPGTPPIKHKFLVIFLGVNFDQNRKNQLL